MTQALEFSVKHDVEATKRKFRGLLSPAQITRITTQALNKVGTTIRADFVRKTSRTTGIKQKLIREQLTVLKAKRDRLRWRLGADRAKAINLIEFVAPNRRNIEFFRKRTQRKTAFGTGRGYKWRGVQANAWREKKIYRGTFVIKDKKGRMQVYKRTSDERTRITPVSGPSVKQLFKSPTYQQSARKVMSRRWRIEFDRAMRLAALKAGISV
jgi:hypothetical protein